MVPSTVDLPSAQRTGSARESWSHPSGWRWRRCRGRQDVRPGSPPAPKSSQTGENPPVDPVVLGRVALDDARQVVTSGTAGRDRRASVRFTVRPARRSSRAAPRLVHRYRGDLAFAGRRRKRLRPTPCDGAADARAAAAGLPCPAREGSPRPRHRHRPGDQRSIAGPCTTGAVQRIWFP